MSKLMKTLKLVCIELPVLKLLQNCKKEIQCGQSFMLFLSERCHVEIFGTIECLTCTYHVHRESWILFLGTYT